MEDVKCRRNIVYTDRRHTHHDRVGSAFNTVDWLSGPQGCLRCAVYTAPFSRLDVLCQRIRRSRCTDDLFGDLSGDGLDLGYRLGAVDDRGSEPLVPGIDLRSHTFNPGPKLI